MVNAKAIFVLHQLYLIFSKFLIGPTWFTQNLVNAKELSHPTDIYIPTANVYLNQNHPIDQNKAKNLKEQVKGLPTLKSTF